MLQKLQIHKYRNTNYTNSEAAACSTPQTCSSYKNLRLHVDQAVVQYQQQEITVACHQGGGGHLWRGPRWASIAAHPWWRCPPPVTLRLQPWQQPTGTACTERFTADTPHSIPDTYYGERCQTWSRQWHSHRHSEQRSLPQLTLGLAMPAWLWNPEVWIRKETESGLPWDKQAREAHTHILESILCFIK